MRKSIVRARSRCRPDGKSAGKHDDMMTYDDYMMKKCLGCLVVIFKGLIVYLIILAH